MFTSVVNLLPVPWSKGRRPIICVIVTPFYPARRLLLEGSVPGPLFHQQVGSQDVSEDISRPVGRIQWVGWWTDLSSNHLDDLSLVTSQGGACFKQLVMANHTCWQIYTYICIYTVYVYVCAYMYILYIYIYIYMYIYIFLVSPVRATHVATSSTPPPVLALVPRCHLITFAWKWNPHYL